MRRALIALVVAALAVVAVAGISYARSSGGSDSSLPKVTGDAGKKPTVKAAGAQPTKLSSKVLTKGDGPEVKKGELLVADYLGQTWRDNKVFDNSYDRGQPAGFPIGVGQVIKGWDDTLVGVKAGSRVELVIPPAEGYGTQGNSQAGIKGDDVLVFVVDVIASYPKDVAKSDAAAQPATAGLPKVTGALGARPTVVVPKGATPPKAATAVVLAKGTGAPVQDGQLAVVEYEAVSWANKPVDTTWGKVPQAFPVSTANPGPFTKLAGVPIGSRVLLLLPPQQGGKAATDSLAVVVDIVAAHSSGGK